MRATTVMVLLALCAGLMPAAAAEGISLEVCRVVRGQLVDCVLSVPTGAVGGWEPAPYGATYCASEGVDCAWDGPGAASIAFGTDGSYHVGEGRPSGTPCTIDQFQDPVPGRPKVCYAIFDGGPSGDAFTRCAGEGQTCQLAGRQDVAYGANGRFHLRTGLQGGVSCNSWTFHDLAAGTSKACYTSPASEQRRAIVGATATPRCGFVSENDLTNVQGPGPGCRIWLGFGYGDQTVPVPRVL